MQVVDKSAVAFGSYIDMAEAVNAFGSLSISTNNQYNDSAQMYAAGFLEGALTQPRIKQQVRTIPSIPFVLQTDMLFSAA
jgi:hypothetical protein